MSNLTVAIASIVAAMTLAAVAFAIPQQALGYKHHDHSDKNSLKVNQQTSQANVCTGAAPADGEDDGKGREERLSAEEAASAPTICQNNGTNTADISR